MNNKGAVVITGASRGLGRNMAKYLSNHGYQVFAGCRKPADISDLVEEAQGRLTPLQLDVTDEDSMAKALETVAKAVGEDGIKALINNAGIVVFGPIEQTPIEKIEEQLKVNVIGPIAMIQQFLPLLRKGKGRIINISSVNGFLSAQYMGIYSASKFALEALSDALRMELKPWGIPVSVVQPGLYQSEIRARSVESWGERLNAMSDEAQKLYQSGFEKSKKLITGFDQRAADPQQVSEVIFEALSADAPKTRYLVGETGRQMIELLTLTDEERDKALLQLWD